MLRVKQHIFVLFLFVGSSSGFAQALRVGDLMVTGNIGTPHLFKGIVKVATNSNAFKTNFDGELEVSAIKGLNPIALKTEYAFKNWFSFGLNYSFWNLQFEVADYYNLQNQSIGTFLKDSVDIYNIKLKSSSLGIRPVLHLAGKNKRNDWYIGLGLGLTKNSFSIDFRSTDIGRSLGPIASQLEKDLPLPGGVYFAPSIGYRRFLNAFAGLNFELGYEKGAVLQAGLSLKLSTKKKQLVSE